MATRLDERPEGSVYDPEGGEFSDAINKNYSSDPDEQEEVPSETERLKDAESGGSESQDSDSSEDAEREKLGKGFTDDAKAKKSGFADRTLGKKRPPSSPAKKKAFIAGATVGGAILLIVGIMLFVAMLIAPFKQVHFATVLRSTGMGIFQLQTARQFSRASLHAAMITDGSVGRPTEVRTSLTQRLRLVNPEKQLKKLGREGKVKFTFEGEKSWTNLTGQGSFKSITVDGKTLSLDDFSNGRGYQNLSFREKLTARNNFVKAIQSGLSTNLALESRMARSGTYNGIRQVTGIKMTKWANKARDYAGKDIKTATKQNTQETSKRISGDATVKSSLPGVNEAVESMKNGEGTEKALEKSKNVSENFDKAGKASLAVFASTMACVVHDLNNSFSGAAKEREIQMDRMGHDALTTGDQIKSGEVVAEAVGAESNRWENADQSILYKQSVGGTINPSDQAQLAGIAPLKASTTFAQGIAATETAIDNLTLPLLSQIPGVGTFQNKMQDQVCKVVLNPYAQWSVAATETVATVIAAFFSAGGAAAGKIAVQSAFIVSVKQAFYLGASMGLGEMLGQLIQNQVNQFSSYSGAETGKELYNNSAVSVNMLSQTGTRQINYGRPQDNEEATQTYQAALATQKATLQNESFSQRYFALTNPYSLTGQLVARTPVGISDSARSFSSLIGGMIHFPQAIFSNIFSGRVFAASDSPAGILAGVTQWGWTEGEWNTVMTDPGYEPDALENYYADHQNDKDGGKTYFEKYQECYDVELQADLPDHCTKDYLGSERAMKWRAYNADLYAADCLSRDDLCIENNAAPNTAKEQVDGDAAELANQILGLAKDGVITLVDYSASPAQDRADRSLASQQLEDISDGKPAQLSSRCNTGGKSETQPDINVLKFLVDLAAQQRFGVNVLFGQCHSDGSQHYDGQAVDLSCSPTLDLDKADSAGKKYGVTRNFETCGGESHWHYSTGRN